MRQSVAMVYVAGVSALLVFAIARVFGPEEFGIYTYVLAVAGIFSMVQDGGFRKLIFRERSGESHGLAVPQEALLNQAIGHLLIVTAVAAVLIAVLPLRDRWLLVLAVACFGLYTASNYVSAYLKGEGRFGADARWAVRLRTITALAIGAVLLFADEPGTASVLVVWALSLMVSLSLPFSRPAWKWPVFKFSTSIYKTCGAFLVIDAATALYFRSDVIMLRYMTDQPTVVGHYGAAFRLIDAAILLAMPVGEICFRHLRLRLYDGKKFIEEFRWMLAGMTAVGLLMAAGGLWLGPAIVELVYGPEYSEAGKLIRLLVVSLFFVMPNVILTQAALALNKEVFYAKTALTCAVFNIGFNYLLIPKYGAFGAAAATIGTELMLGVSLAIGIFWRLEALQTDSRALPSK